MIMAAMSCECGIDPAEPAGLEALLAKAQHGDLAARDAVFAMVYDELKAIALRKAARQAPGHTLQPTALVHEAFLRMGGNAKSDFASSAHFMAVAARAMRSVLVDHARRKHASKRQPPGKRVELDLVLEDLQRRHDVVALDAAMQRLAERDPQLVQLVELRFFAGYEMRECAAALGISESTAYRAWRMARAAMRKELIDD
jgi:RNA polymerase sigma-70 factor (ECF subfamily)